MQRSPIRSIRINNSKEFETDITEENYAELAKGMSLFETVTFCDHSGSTHQLRLKRSSILLLLGAFHTHPELIEKLDLYEKETQNILFISNNKTTSTLLDFILTQEHANLIVQQLSAISWCPLSRNTGSANDKNNYLNSTAMRKFSMPKLQSFGTVIIPGAINPANYRTTYKNYMSESKNYSFENIQFFLSKVLNDNNIFEITAAELIFPSNKYDDNHMTALLTQRQFATYEGFLQLWNAVKKQPAAKDLNDYCMSTLFQRFSKHFPLYTLKLLAALIKSHELEISKAQAFAHFDLVRPIYTEANMSTLSEEEMIYLALLAINGSSDKLYKVVVKHSAFSSIQNLLSLVSVLQDRAYTTLPDIFKRKLLHCHQAVFYEFISMMIIDELIQINEGGAQEMEMLVPDEVTSDLLPAKLPQELDNLEPIEKWILSNPVRNQKLGGMLLQRCSGLNEYSDYRKLAAFLSKISSKAGDKFNFDESCFIPAIEVVSHAIHAYLLARNVTAQGRMVDLAPTSAEILYNQLRAESLSLTDYINTFTEIVDHATFVNLKNEFIVMHLVQVLAYVDSRNASGRELVDCSPIRIYLRQAVAQLPWLSSINKTSNKLRELIATNDLNIDEINLLLASLNTLFPNQDILYALFRDFMLARDVENLTSLIVLPSFDAVKITQFEKLMKEVKLGKDMKYAMVNTLAQAMRNNDVIKLKIDDNTYSAICEIIGLSVFSSDIAIIEKGRYPLKSALHLFLTKRENTDKSFVIHHQNSRLFGRSSQEGLSSLPDDINLLIQSFQLLVNQSDRDDYSRTMTFIMADSEAGYTNLYHIYSGLVLFSQNNNNEPDLHSDLFDLGKLLQDCSALIQEYEKSTRFTRILAQQVRMQEKQLATQAKQLSAQANKIEEIVEMLRVNSSRIPTAVNTK